MKYFAVFENYTITVRQLPTGLAQITREVKGASDQQLQDAVWVSPNRSMEEWVSIQEHPELYTPMKED